MLDEIIAKLRQMPEDKRKELVDLAIEKTGHLKFIPSPGPQTLAYHSKADILLFGGEPGGGKRLDNETPVPVPLWVDASGFKKHGDLRAGDYIYSPSGIPVEVKQVHPVVEETDAYEVIFDTGELIIADGDHLWLTKTHADRQRELKSSEAWRAKRRAGRPSRAVAVSKKPAVSAKVAALNRQRTYEISQVTGGIRTTREIAMSLLGNGGRLNHSIDVTRPLLDRPAKLPIEPYLLGLWIGDGYSKCPSIGMASEDWESISVPPADNIYLDRRPQRKKLFEVRSFRFMRAALKELGVFGAKRIPPLYLRASLDQRIALLQGIMDTDGHCNKSGQLSCGFSNKALADDLHELLSSLGVKCVQSTKNAKCQNGNGQPHYHTKFMCPFPAFRLQRKLCRQKLADLSPIIGRRFIKGVRKVKSVPMRCITVANSDGLYLVGRSFIATHNTGLLIGLALNSHHRSLIVRKQFSDVEGVIDNAKEMLGTGYGFVGGGRPKYRKPDGGVIHFEGVAGSDSFDTGKQGNPHDFIGVDEGAQLSEDAIRLLIGWNRTKKVGQRCRMVIATNPPVDTVGDWMADFFAPWLDPKHPDPAEDGELRWFVIGPKGNSIEVSNSDPVTIDGVVYYPHSRSFIRSKLEDNPFFDPVAYRAKLQLMPEPYRTMLLSGNFLLARTDDEKQVIPTAWVLAAQARWKPVAPVGIPMTTIGVDVGKSSDPSVIAPRYDWWFAPMTIIPSDQRGETSDLAGKIIAKRRDDALVVVDLGGGWGGEVFGHLKSNNVKAMSYLGVEKSGKFAKGNQLRFFNVRTEAYWRLREALDPDQPGGAFIALPPSKKLVADLCAPLFWIEANGIHITSKEDVCDKLGRSPDEGDSVVMCWFAGTRPSHKQNLSNSGKLQSTAIMQRPRR